MRRSLRVADMSGGGTRVPPSVALTAQAASPESTGNLVAASEGSAQAESNNAIANAGVKCTPRPLNFIEHPRVAVSIRTHAPARITPRAPSPGRDARSHASEGKLTANQNL